MFLVNFLIHLLSTWDRFLVDFQVILKRPRVQKYCKKQWFLKLFCFSCKDILNSILIDFWANLGSKIDQKSIKNRSKNQSLFWSLFWSIFDRFLVHFGTQVGPKTDKKMIKSDFNMSLNKKHKTCKNHVFLKCFWALGLFKMSWKSTKNRSKVDQKSIKKMIKKLIVFMIDFWSILARFWVPSWTQNQ